MAEQTIDQILEEGRLTTIQKRTIKKALQASRDYDTISINVLNGGATVPTFTTLKNETGRTIDFSRQSTGNYIANVSGLTGYEKNGKIKCFFTPTNAGVFWSINQSGTFMGQQKIETKNPAGEFTDGLLNGFLEIRIYKG